jgi:transketolase
MGNLEAEAYTLRKNVLNMIYRAKTGHIGGDFSVMEILVALYGKVMNFSPENQADPNRDYFVLSKGHSVEAYYSVLAAKGFFTNEELLKEYSQFGSPFIGHPNNRLPGIEMNSGSLGHGLPVCIGIAKTCKMDGRPSRVYTVMGDGELAEGSVWEGVMAASHYALDNLCVTVDRNRLQISGSTEDVMHHENLAERFRAFGWNVISVEGNNISALCEAYETAKTVKGKPTVVIANTTKGCGVSFMENQAGWHHRVPTEEEYRRAMEELDRKEEALRNESNRE